jgi:hypothetical protein
MSNTPVNEQAFGENAQKMIDAILQFHVIASSTATDELRSQAQAVGQRLRERAEIENERFRTEAEIERMRLRLEAHRNALVQVASHKQTIAGLLTEAQARGASEAELEFYRLQERLFDAQLEKILVSSGANADSATSLLTWEGNREQNGVHLHAHTASKPAPKGLIRNGRKATRRSKA